MGSNYKMEANKKMTKFTTYTKYSNGRTLPNFWEQMNEEEEIALLDGDGTATPRWGLKVHNRWRGYAYSSFILLSMVIFILLVKLVDCTDGVEMLGVEEIDEWTKQCLTGLSIMAAFCLVLGCSFLAVAKSRERYYLGGYQEI